MIRKDDLQEAIAECLGKRDPDANTCIKLASYYTILDQLYPENNAENPAPELRSVPAYSFAGDPDVIRYQGDSEFASAIDGRSVSHIMPIIDEAMGALQVLQPKLYGAVMRRIVEE